MILYPVNLNITDKACLVIGGGNVALRKIRSLVRCNAKVTVISPDVMDEIRLLAENGEISLYQRGYASGDLAGAFLVFAATDNPEVQAAVNDEAAKHNILLNSANDPDRCDFQVPAKVRRGSMLMTVSTGGASPALSKLIRQQLEDQFTDEYGRVVALFAEIRNIVVAEPASSVENKRLFKKLLDSDIVELTCNGDWDGVSAILESSLPAGVDIEQLLKNLDSRRADRLTG